MVDRLRQFAQTLKNKISVPQISGTSREKVDQILTKYVPATKVTAIAENFKKEAITMKFKELVSKYEKFTGVEEIMALQTTVITAQERFMSAQDRRRGLGRQLANLEARLKELHAEMQNTMKGEEKYLHQCTEEHKLIIQERALRTLFADAEREERELFAAMSAAVKLGHERERAHAERNKYWYIVASIFGTVLGIAGSTLNNRLKMAEFRDLLQQQLARSAGALAAVSGADGAGAGLADAMQAELAYQQQLAQNIEKMQDSISGIVHKQSAIMEHLQHQSRSLDAALRELSRAIASASQSSRRSDESLAAALNAVHQDLEDTTEKEKEREKHFDKENEEGQAKLVVGVACLVAGAALAALMSRS